MKKKYKLIQWNCGWELKNYSSGGQRERSSQRVPSFAHRRTRNMFIFIYISIILGVVIVAFAFFYFYRVIKPIKKIIQTCREVKKGNLDVAAEVQGKTKTGELAHAINEMIEDLRSSRAASEEARAVFEIKVAARTKELEELTEILKEEIKERTKELQTRVDELEKFQRLTVGRELKMIELKKEIKQLNEELGKQKTSKPR